MKRLSDSSRLENHNKTPYSSWVNPSKPHVLNRQVTRNPAHPGQQKRYSADDPCLNDIAAPYRKAERKNVYPAPFHFALSVRLASLPRKCQQLWAL